MTAYKCLVADDSMLERDVLHMHLSKMDQLEIVSVCSDGLEAAKVLAQQDIDIVFSDIDMPDLSGLGLLKTLKQAPVFVFISSHPEYAAESFDLDVVDFIVKPVTMERLLRAVNKAIEYIELKSSHQHQPKPDKELNEENSIRFTEADDHFFVRESPDIVKVRFEEISYIESMGNFSKIYMINNKKHVILVSLKILESQLPDSIFTRIHKQYMINHRVITSIGTDDVALSNEHTVPLGASYRQQLMDKVVNKKIVTRFS